MKKIPFLVMSLLTLPSYAQSILNSLNQYQNSLQTSQSQTSTTSTSSSTQTSSPDVKPSMQTTTSNSLKCEEPDQTSLPLAYVTSLIQQKNGQLDIIHDQSTGKLTISSADMIGNCSSMLEWNLKQPEIQGRSAFALEVKLKQGEKCDKDKGCTYKVAHVENGEFKEFKEIQVKPTLKGFEECLQKSGVVSNGKVVPGAIYNLPVNEKFEGVNQSGKLYFLAHGPSTPLVKAKYGKFEHVSGCDYYEHAHPTIKSLLTAEDAERERLDAEAARLRDCKVDEYGKLAEFIEKYEGYQSQLGDVRDRLILEAVKKSTAAIDSGKFTDEDLKVIGDFERYVVLPKVNRARALYEELLDLEGDARKVKQEELVKLLSDISALGKKPYFLASHTQKLVAAGKFDEAEKLNSVKLIIEHHQRLGAKQDNVVISTGVASQRVAAGKAAFAQALVKEKERYEYRTGQTSGNAGKYSGLASKMRQNIQTRTQNYNAEIQLEYQRMQPGGYCYKYWRNTQKCLQDSVERIQELQATLQHFNNIDQERASEYDALAKDYGDLEAQGRRYLAAQNGEEVPAQQPVSQPEAPVDTTTPQPRPEEPQAPQGAYSFQWQGGQGQPQQPMPQQYYQQQAQMMPQQYQYPTSPYQNNNMFVQQQNPYGYYPQQQMMGQQSYNFNWNGGGGMQSPYGYQQQQQMPFYNNPYQAYGNLNYYRR